jgi:hypothetical protein
VSATHEVFRSVGEQRIGKFTGNRSFDALTDAFTPARTFTTSKPVATSADTLETVVFVHSRQSLYI